MSVCNPIYFMDWVSAISIFILFQYYSLQKAKFYICLQLCPVRICYIFLTYLHCIYFFIYVFAGWINRWNVICVCIVYTQKLYLYGNGWIDIYNFIWLYFCIINMHIKLIVCKCVCIVMLKVILICNVVYQVYLSVIMFVYEYIYI